ncbi:hypothetical protein niasHS_001340 [Heterodera schachtii]|uniref:Lon proteolytic domain-containing protein n=1 Tax=Heterodera schachtii TaxID=97005 RepID=A0ABD2KLK3_HETSC
MAFDYVVNRMQKREFGFCVALNKTNSPNESGGRVFFVATKLFNAPTQLLVTVGGGNLDEIGYSLTHGGCQIPRTQISRQKRGIGRFAPSRRGVVVKGVAVTGATALNGDVKHVSGIGQKVTAAVKSPVTRIIMRKLNGGDFKALQIELSSKIKVIYVSNLDEAYANVFGNDDNDDTF